jgi:acetyl esterase/lipase
VYLVIDIHGGAHMLGSSSIISMDQVRDCLARNWIVVAANHRLCPGVDILSGPMRDCRDLLAWIYDGKLATALADAGVENSRLDYDHVFAMGTSAGGHLALSLVSLLARMVPDHDPLTELNPPMARSLIKGPQGFDVPRPVAGIYDMYGACDFSAPFWRNKVPHIAALIPKEVTESFTQQVYSQIPVPTKSRASLEGHAVGKPDFTDPRQAFVMTQVANGKVLEALCPSGDFSKVDPLRNIGPNFPPTYITHGVEDRNISIEASRKLYRELQSKGVQCGMTEVPDEGHTFAAKMEPGSKTWELQRKGFDFLGGLIAKD